MSVIISHIGFSVHINKSMRIQEFLPESWWKDLDPGFIGMMGYTEETLEPKENPEDLVSSVANDIKSIRRRPR